jgi:hypothetical protein
MSHFSAPFPHERRRSERIPIRCPVELEAAGHRVRGVTKNLSTTGAMLLLPSRFGLGVEVALRIELPDGREPLDLTAMIVWQDDAPRSPHPTGAHFLLPPADALARIRDLIYEP